MKNVRMMKSVEELVTELRAEGHTIDLKSAEALWNKAKVNTLNSKGPTERTLKLAKRLSPEMYTDAAKNNQSLSDLLEDEDPTEPGSRDEMLGIDAYTRQISLLSAENGEPIRIYPEGGQQAHELGELLGAGVALDGIGGSVTSGSVLAHELFRRAFAEGGVHGTSLFYGSSLPLWEGLNPQYLTTPIANQPRLRRPLLNDLIAIRTTVKQPEFKFPEIVNQAAQSRLRRVAEAADFPVVRLVVSTKSGSIHKFALVIEISDEAARRTPIDIVRFHFVRIGAQNAEDKTVVAIETITNGAQNTDITTVGGAGDGTVVSKALDNFLGIFEEDGYVPTVCIGQRAVTTELKNAHTDTPNQSVFRGPDRIMRGGAHPEEIDHPPIYSRTAAAADKLLYVDSTRALAEATEAGSSKEETDRNIRNGTNVITLQEVVGYHTIDDDARRTLDTQS